MTTDKLDEADVSLPLEPRLSLCFESARDGFGDTEGAGGTGDRIPVRRGGGGSMVGERVCGKEATEATRRRVG